MAQWKHLKPFVRILQVTGVFWHVMNEDRGYLKASSHILLFLWAFLLRSFSLTLLIIKTIGISHRIINSVGDLVFNLSLIAHSATSVLCLLILCCRSSALASILRKLEALDKFISDMGCKKSFIASQKPSLSSNCCRDSLLVFLSAFFWIFVLAFIIYSVAQSIQEGTSNFSPSLTTDIFIHFTMITMLSMHRITFKLLAQSLERALSLVSFQSPLDVFDLQVCSKNAKMFPVDGSIVTITQEDLSDDETYYSELQFLASAFCMIHNIKTDYLSYIGIPFGLFILGDLCMIVSVMYRTVLGADYILYILLFLSSVTTITVIHNSPEILRRQAGWARSSLLAFWQRSSNDSTINQVNLLLERLQDILDTSISGAYSLGNQHLLSLTGVVVAYLVVVLQVGFMNATTQSPASNIASTMSNTTK